MATKYTHNARIGFLGNPSDGYFGKTISLSLANYWASVTLLPSEKIVFVPHPVYDRASFNSLEDLTGKVKGEGYYGGVRLLMAVCVRFSEYCREKAIELDESRGNFTLSYDTNIPRQVGLSGSSAIVASALGCLLDHFGVRARVPVGDLPGLVLSAEQDLGIAAGLQDRVIQVHGGVVYMDFAEEHFQATGRGRYSRLPADLLPPHLYLIFCDNPSESGKVHSSVRERWQAGDVEIRARMAEVAEVAERGRGALKSRDYETLAKLIDRNFDLRRLMFGDEALGATNLRIVELARSVGAAAKFTGSGGAVLAFCKEGAEQVERLKSACAAEGFTVVPVNVGPVTQELAEDKEGEPTEPL